MDILLKTLILLGCAIVGYLFGSIPSGIIICKLFYGVDPRESGSKNPGGTNVGRVVGKKAGILTITCDILKVLIPFFTTFALFTYCEPIVNFMLGANREYNSFGQGNTLAELAYYLVIFGAMIGHSYSIFLKFKGGKLVATYSGFALATSWTALPVFCPLFFIVVKLKKYVSVGSMVMCGAFMLYTWVVYIVFIFCGPTVAGYFMLSEFGPHASIYVPIIATISYALVVYKHRTNIKNLINHTEKTAGWNKKN